MKKFFAVLMMMLVSAGVFASEAAIKEVIMAYRKADAAMDIKAIDYLSDDFSGTVLGRPIDRAKMKTAIECFQLMISTDDLEIFMEKAFEMQGVKMDDNMRQQVRGLKNSENGKKYLEQSKNQIKLILKAAAEGMKNLVFKDCSITGNTAVISVEVLDAMSGKVAYVKYGMVKRGGKWLIRSVELTFK